MAREKNAQTKLTRLGQILRIFMETEDVASSWLSGQFHTTPRTIQRDLLLLKEAGFPLHEHRKGVHRMSKDLVKNLEVFDDTELALVIALKNLVGQLGKPFQDAADGVLDRLRDYLTAMPVFVKIDDSVPLDSALLSRIVKAVREKRRVCFQYASPRGTGTHPVDLEPYRVVYFDGFWYLAGNEPCTGILKRYALDRIRDLRLSGATFKGVPDGLDAILRGSANIWFGGERNLAVTVLVDPQVSHYFRRRTMYPTQEIREERPDGSVVVSFRVRNYESIESFLKAWIPHVSIIEPLEFGDRLLIDMTEWIRKQGGICRADRPASG